MNCLPVGKGFSLLLIRPFAGVKFGFCCLGLEYRHHFAQCVLRCLLFRFASFFHLSNLLLTARIAFSAALASFATFRCSASVVALSAAARSSAVPAFRASTFAFCLFASVFASFTAFSVFSSLVQLKGLALCRTARSGGVHATSTSSANTLLMCFGAHNIFPNTLD